VEELQSETTESIQTSIPMKTTLDLPPELIDEAMRAGNCGTKTAAIVLALQQFVRLQKLSRLRAMRGSMPGFSLDLDTLRGRACKA
jgi:Arc/MetJ family transcription regulator